MLVFSNSNSCQLGVLAVSSIHFTCFLRPRCQEFMNRWRWMEISSNPWIGLMFGVMLGWKRWFNTCIQASTVQCPWKSNNIYHGKNLDDFFRIQDQNETNMFAFVWKTVPYRTCKVAKKHNKVAINVRTKPYARFFNTFRISDSHMVSFYGMSSICHAVTSYRCCMVLYGNLGFQALLAPWQPNHTVVKLWLEGWATRWKLARPSNQTYLRNCKYLDLYYFKFLDMF